MSHHPGSRWELLIDPNAAYMVRFAKMYRRGKDQPKVMISNSGIKWFGAYCIPESTDWKDFYAGNRTFQLHFQTASSNFDEEFFERAHMSMHRPYKVPTDVIDQRMKPSLFLHYHEGEILPASPKAQAKDIEFEALEQAKALTPEKQPTTQIEKSQDESPRHNKSLDSTPFSQVGTTAQSSETKNVAAWLVLLLSVTVGIAYFSFRVRRSWSSEEN